jgi:hypothetical protein
VGIAIADADAARRAAMKARDAEERAIAMIATAEAKLSQAMKAIEKARDAQATNLAKAATSRVKPRADTGTREARIREADARDTLDAAKAALATCEQILAEHEHALRRTEQPVAADQAEIFALPPSASPVRELR